MFRNQRAGRESNGFHDDSSRTPLIAAPAMQVLPYGIRWTRMVVFAMNGTAKKTASYVLDLNYG